MFQEEVNIRMKITRLQSSYRDKQLRLQKLKTPRKKKLKGGAARQRGPGRPKKKTFPNPRTKMGRPRKAGPEGPASSPDRGREDQGGRDSDAPPVLEPQGPQAAEDDNSAPGSSSSLLKPPRLTASSSPPPAGSGANTSLSTLTTRFMKGKANPFANLLSQLAAGPSASGQEAEDEAEEKFSDESGSDPGSESSSFKFGKTSKLSYCLEAYQHNKKRKAERPKKNSGGSSETIVPKKPRNLFMMLDFQRGFGVRTAEDEYTFEDEDGGDLAGRQKMFEARRSSSPSVRSTGSVGHWSDDENTQVNRSSRQ